MPQRPTAPALRVAVVATTAAAAAALSVLPTTLVTPAAPTADAAPGAPVTRDVVPAAHAVPAAGVNPAALNAAAASTAASSSAQAAAVRGSAMSTALAQVGKPYVYGASGPHAFDCSGLVSYAFKKAGKQVPRTSKAQASAGTKVSKANLRPGDLVFFYTPVSHVGIYIGNGKVVHASTSGEPVKTSKVSAMPFNSARRL